MHRTVTLPRGMHRQQKNVFPRSQCSQLERRTEGTGWFVGDIFAVFQVRLLGQVVEPGSSVAEWSNHRTRNHQPLRDGAYRLFSEAFPITVTWSLRWMDADVRGAANWRNNMHTVTDVHEFYLQLFWM